MFCTIGIGTGIRRCISLGIKPEFKNDENLNEFVIVIPRLDENGNQVTKSDEKSNQVENDSNQVKGEKELSHPKLTK